MNILKRIFASPDDASTLVNGAVAGVDKLFFTAEEKAEANAKLQDWYLKWLDATQSQTIARRLIAFIVAALWALLVLIGVLGWIASKDFAEFTFKILTDIVATPFGIVIGFYFLTHTVREYKK